MCVCVCIGQLKLGDQILVCDGVSLLDVTHDEAAQSLKRAMDMESVNENTLQRSPRHTPEMKTPP